MSSYLLHPLPRRGAVVREQLRSTGLSLRREGLALGGLLAAFTLYMGWLAANGVRPELPFVPQAAAPLLVLALLIPMGVWKGEDPSRRLYHWSMPISHGEHALARSFSGWTWSMAAVAGYLAWVLGMALATGGDIAVESRLAHLPDRGVWRDDFAIAPWRWVAPFTGATILYLFGSALVLATRFPVRWLGGGVAGLMFLGIMRVGGEPNPLHQAVRWVWEAPLGLETALSGKSPVAPDWIVFGVEHASGVMHRTPAFGTWMLSTWLWLAIALSVFLFAAYRQPER